MERISSPGWYSRTSEKAMPRPLKALWYSPENTWLERPLVLISIFLTFLRSSVVSKGTANYELRMGAGDLPAAAHPGFVMCFLLYHIKSLRITNYEWVHRGSLQLKFGIRDR